MVHLAMSRDSTCTNQEEYETYKLRIKPTLPLPPLTRKTVCR